MNYRLFLIVFFLGFISVIAFLTWHYVLSIYEVDYEITSNNLNEKTFLTNSEIVIKAVPINALGTKIPVRSSPINYQIQEGENFIDILEFKSEEGFIRLKTKDKSGIVKIQVKAKYALLPTIIEIPITSETAYNKKQIIK